MSDYLELPLYLDNYDEGATVNLWIHTTDGKPIVLKDVNADPVRYQGWWSIGHAITDSVRATALIPADLVRYFVVLDHQSSHVS